MKFPIIGGIAFALSGAAALAAVAVLNAPEDAKAPAAPANLTSTVEPVEAASAEFVFSVPDMHCEVACAPKVRETLAAVPGVEKVETDVEKQTATVVTRDGFDAEKAIAALTDAGYPAKALTE